MVIDCRRQIGLYFGSVFADRKFWPVLDVTLYEHHPMWFAEAFGGTVEGFSVSPEVLPAESGFIQKEGPDSASYFSVTPQGREACRYLENDLDISIRREIVEQIRKHDLGTSKPTFSHAEYDRTVTGGSRVYLRQVIAGEKALEITMAVPGQEAARVICESWPLRSEKAYEMLMDLLLK